MRNFPYLPVHTHTPTHTHARSSQYSCYTLEYFSLTVTFSLWRVCGLILQIAQAIQMGEDEIWDTSEEWSKQCDKVKGGYAEKERNEQREQLTVIKGAFSMCVALPCENGDMHKSFCVCVCARVLQAGGGFWWGRAVHSCWVVMSWELALHLQTDSPVYVPLSSSNHTVWLTVYVRDMENMSVCVCPCAYIAVRLCYWLKGVVGKPRGTWEGVLSPRRREPLTDDAFLWNIHTERGSFSCFSEHSSNADRLLLWAIALWY